MEGSAFSSNFLASGRYLFQLRINGTLLAKKINELEASSGGKLNTHYQGLCYVSFNAEELY